MKFEWDDEKNKNNIKKHGIDFEIASRVFADPYRIEMYDMKHSIEEDRFITIGDVGGYTYIVVVVYTERYDSIRMISARKATEKERRKYHDCRERY